MRVDSNASTIKLCLLAMPIIEPSLKAICQPVSRASTLRATGTFRSPLGGSGHRALRNFAPPRPIAPVSMTDKKNATPEHQTKAHQRQ